MAAAPDPACGQISNHNRTFIQLRIRHRSERHPYQNHVTKADQSGQTSRWLSGDCNAKLQERVHSSGQTATKTPTQGVVRRYNTVLQRADTSHTAGSQSRLSQWIRSSSFEQLSLLEDMQRDVLPVECTAETFLRTEFCWIGFSMREACRMFRLAHCQLALVHICVLAGRYGASSSPRVCLRISGRRQKLTTHRLVSRSIRFCLEYVFRVVEQVRGKEGYFQRK